MMKNTFCNKFNPFRFEGSIPLLFHRILCGVKKIQSFQDWNMKTFFVIAALSFLMIGCSGKGKNVILETNYGTIEIKLYDDAAPVHSENFRKLAAEGFYDSLQFHRIIPGFVIQGGDPNTKTPNKMSYGQGGPGYTLPAEIGKPHLRGSVGMAREGDQVNPQRRSNGSQFYICLQNLPSLDGKYTVFGEVVKGMDVVDSISVQPRDARDVPIKPVYILKAYLEK
jgi:cyclophilin family peptidyl-prolyl cis-trans isomerase